MVGQVPLPPLGDHELLVFWCQLVALLAMSQLGGWAARALGQPRVIGELLAGVALGPSIAGEIWPAQWRWLFPDDDRQAGLLLGLAWFGIVLLLMKTGVDTDLGLIRQQGRAAATTAVGSLVVPLGVGIALGLVMPAIFVGGDTDRWVFAVFIGIAMAISSLPVAARIMSDLGVLTAPIGQLACLASSLRRERRAQRSRCPGDRRRDRRPIAGRAERRFLHGDRAHGDRHLGHRRSAPARQRRPVEIELDALRSARRVSPGLNQPRGCGRRGR